MSINYEMVAKCWKRNKSALTRATNQKDFKKVLKVCDQAFADFDAYGWPDDWALFQRAFEDAEWQLRRAA